MKYIKTFEKFDDKVKKLYSFEDLKHFIDWFVNVHEDTIKKEGWLISYSFFNSKDFTLPKFNDNNKANGYWQIQRNDEDEIIENDLVAEELAKKYKLLLNSEGVVIGYNDVSFIDHPEELKYYKNINKYNI